MKATVRVVISVLALVVAGAVTAPAASGVSPAPRDVTSLVVAAPAAAGAVVSVTPARIADSRDGLQIPGPVGAVGTAVVQLTGRGGIPGIGVAAVLATVTVVAPQEAGYITVWPSAAVRPDASNLNFQAGQIIANTVLVRVGADGGIQLLNGSYGSAHLIVDVTGYTLSGTPSAAGAVVSVLPARIADSRIGVQISGAVSAVGTASVQVTGRGGIPGNGVAEVVATVTAVGPPQPGYVTVWPSLTARPGTSNQNFQAGQNIATTVVLPLGVDGKIQLFNGSDGNVDLLVDVTGYTLAGIATVAGTVGPVTARLTDTRTGPQVWGAVPALGAIEVQVAAPGAGAVAAAVLTVTAVEPQTGGYVTVWPSGDPRPGTSNLNFQAARNVATTVVVPVGADGKVRLFNGSYGTVHLIVDITGYVQSGQNPVHGAVWAWGGGFQGELGNGTTANSAVPVAVFGLSDVTAIAGGGATGYALRRDGTVWAWGSGDFGSLGNRTGIASPVPVQVSGLTEVVAIAGGFATGYALRGDGTVWAWGSGYSGQLGDGDDERFSVAPVQVSGLTDATAIAAGDGTAYALRSNGTVWAWGNGSQGQLGIGDTATNRGTPVQVSELTDVTAIAAGSGTAFALRSNGTVWAWGNGSQGQLGNGFPFNSGVPGQVPALNTVTAIAAGNYTGYARLTDGTVRAWGNGAYGALGNGGTLNGPVPVAVFALAEVTSLAGGFFTGYARLTDGTVRAWGYGVFGQLGNQAVSNSAVPVPVYGLTGVSAIASGGEAGYATTP